MQFLKAAPFKPTYAQIDMKNTLLRIKDGYSGPNNGGFLVNNGGGYPSSTVTMTIDTGTGIIQNGDTFTVAGDTTGLIHTVTSHTETTGNTTSITFTPALGASVADDAAITIYPHQLIVKIGEGTLSWTEKRAYKYVTDRGKLSSVREEDEQPVEVKFDAIWEFIKGDSADPGGGLPTIKDVLTHVGLASLWVSSATDPCEPYSVDLELTYTPVCTGVKTEIVTLHFFRYESFEADLKNGNFVLSGKCNVTQASSVRQ